MRVLARDRTFIRVCWLAGVVCLAPAVTGYADAPDTSKPPVLCTIEANNCEAPAKDLRRASAAYWQGVKRSE